MTELSKTEELQTYWLQKIFEDFFRSLHLVHLGSLGEDSLSLLDSSLGEEPARRLWNQPARLIPEQNQTCGNLLKFHPLTANVGFRVVQSSSQSAVTISPSVAVIHVTTPTNPNMRKMKVTLRRSKPTTTRERRSGRARRGRRVGVSSLSGSKQREAGSCSRCRNP